MKKTVLLVAFCAALCAMLASCSQLQTGNTATVSIDSKQLLENARWAYYQLDGEMVAGDITIYFAIEVDGEIRKSTKRVSNSNLPSTKFSFSDIPLNSKVKVYCLAWSHHLDETSYPYGAGCPKMDTSTTGSSEEFTMEVGANNITVNMGPYDYYDYSLFNFFADLYGFPKQY